MYRCDGIRDCKRYEIRNGIGYLFQLRIDKENVPGIENEH